MGNPYKDGGVGAKAKMKRMLGQEPSKNVGKFSDAPASEDEIKKFVGGYDIRMPDAVDKPKARLDRRARGGRTAKKKGHTTVNVLVGGHGAPQPSPGPMPVPPGHGGGAPVPPPAPPMPMGGMPMPPGGMPPMPMAGGAPMGAPPPGIPPRPGMMPPGMMPRKRGGKVVGDKGPASGKSTPMDKGRRGQSGWKVPRIHLKPKAPERNTRG